MIESDGKSKKHRWFRLWAPDLLGKADRFGFSMLDDMTAEERWCWIALKALCAMHKSQPLIYYYPCQGYPDNELARQFGVRNRVWQETKLKLTLAGLIDVDKNNVITINDWDYTSGTFTHDPSYIREQEKGISPEQRLRDMEVDRDKKAIVREIITYLDQKAKRDYRITSHATFKLMSDRYDEGARLEHFQHVVNVKVSQWMGTDMDKFLRPSTLFAKDKFWEYWNEYVPNEGMTEEEIRQGYTNEDKAKYGSLIRKEYDERLKAYMERNGLSRIEEINLMDVPNYAYFFRMRLHEHKAKEKKNEDAIGNPIPSGDANPGHTGSSGDFGEDD